MVYEFFDTEWQGLFVYFGDEFLVFMFHFFISFCIQVLLKLISPLFSEKAMAPHFSTLAWKIPWMEEPGGLQSMGLLRVGHC